MLLHVGYNFTHLKTFNIERKKEYIICIMITSETVIPSQRI